MTSSKPNHLPKTSPTNTITLGLEHQHMNIEGDKLLVQNRYHEDFIIIHFLASEIYYLKFHRFIKHLSFFLDE